MGKKQGCGAGAGAAETACSEPEPEKNGATPAPKRDSIMEK